MQITIEYSIAFALSGHKPGAFRMVLCPTHADRISSMAPFVTHFHKQLVDCKSNFAPLGPLRSKVSGGGGGRTD